MIKLKPFVFGGWTLSSKVRNHLSASIAFSGIQQPVEFRSNCVGTLLSMSQFTCLNLRLSLPLNVEWTNFGLAASHFYQQWGADRESVLTNVSKIVATGNSGKYPPFNKILFSCVSWQYTIPSKGTETVWKLTKEGFKNFSCLVPQAY